MANIGSLMAYLGVDTKGLDKAEKKVKGSTKRMEASFKGVGKAIIAAFGAREVIHLFTMEVTKGLKAVEDFNISVASMSGFIATFSAKTAEGDIAGGFKEANRYAQELIPRLEILDAKTVATGRDLTIMAETMAMNGVVLDINNKKQEEGFVNIANALKLVTQGQNSEIQMRQEINALLMGQMRMTDRLPKVLKAVDSNIKEHIKLWRQEGTVIENVGKLLDSFGQATDLITQTWAAIGTTLDTIHRRILRGGMRSMYEDILNIVKDLNSSLMQQDGNLTDLAKTIVGGIAAGWEVAKSAIMRFWYIGKALLPVAKLLGVIFDGIGMALVSTEPIVKRIMMFAESTILEISAGLKLLTGDMVGAKADWDKSGKIAGEVFSLGLTDEMERAFSKYQAAKKIGFNLDTERVEVPLLAHKRNIEAVQKVIDADKKALDKRIKEWESFYSKLDKAMSDHYKKEYDLIKENGELVKSQIEIRKSTENLLYSLQAGQGTYNRSRTDEEDFNLERSDLANQLEAANRLTGSDKVSALEDYKQAVYDLAVLFNEGIDLKSGYLSGFDIYSEAIKDIEDAYASQKVTQDEMMAANIKAQEENKIWGETLIQTAEEASIELDRLHGIALALDDQIAAMDSYIELDVEDQASHVINGIQMEIDLLREVAGKPIVITTIHKEVFGSTGSVAPPSGDAFGGQMAGSYSSGTPRIPRDGMYKLHRDEEIVPAGENKEGKGMSMRDIKIYPQPGSDGKIDWRRVVRDEIKPELDRL